MADNTPLMNTIIRSARPYFSEQDISEIKEAVGRILDSGVLILGPYVEELEKKFAHYIGVKHALALSSCTSALEVAMRYFNVNGYEVIVPTNTFIACPNSVVFAGGKPAFADIDPNTYSVNIETVFKKTSDKTKGIMAVHLGGLPIEDIRAIKEECEKKSLFLIEDCSHAHGATLNGKKAGSFGDVGCFSLMATKIITSGLGGLLTTDDDSLYEYALTLRNSASGKSCNFEYIASDWMMSEISAAIALKQLGNIERYIDARNSLALRYKEHLGSIKELSFHEPSSKIRQTNYKFLATLDKNVVKDKLVSSARKKGIEIGTLYEKPCHMQPIYQKIGCKAGDCPVSEEALKHQIALPMHVKLNDNDIETVCSFLRNQLCAM